LHCSAIATPDPVVVRRAACGKCTAGGYRTGLGLSRTTESWYNGVAYCVLNVLVNHLSYCFCRRAGGLLIVYHSGRDDCGEGGVVSLAGRGSGKRDQSYEGQEQHLALMLRLATLDFFGYQYSYTSGQSCFSAEEDLVFKQSNYNASLELCYSVADK